jgi:uncharacterized protein
VVIRWGELVVPGAPPFDFDRQTAAAQSRQFGYNCDFVWFLPLPGRSTEGSPPERALLVVNHEYTSEELMFRGYSGGATATAEQIRVGIAAHGLSVLEIERVGASGQWRPARRGLRRNRRITGDTPLVLTGPAAGAALLRTAADPGGTRVRGTLSNCGGGTTPWGTILTGEENFNHYFVGADGVPDPARAALARYGFSTTTRVPAGHRGWERVDERFDLTRHPNEANRFGWVVEIDPYDPESVPRKRTALGRFKHEAADVTLTRDRRMAVYMGDDERFEYLYKYVSTDRLRPGDGAADRAHNRTLLDEGTLHVARLTGDSPAVELDGSGKPPSDGAFDGRGEWIPLVTGGTSHVAGMSADEVLVHTRLAADRVGATRMDRPEEVERNPVTGAVYVALTNNKARTPAQVDEANPRAANKHGHVLELVEDDADPGARTFGWSIPLVCGDPGDPATYFAGYDKTKVSPISCPDNLAFDAAGNLWIATDGNALGSHDGLFAMPLAGPERGRVKQFLSAPTEAEVCGPLITPDQRSCFVAIQHPGERDGASVDHPASTWPDGGPPRPSVVAVWRTAPGSGRIGA